MVSHWLFIMGQMQSLILLNQSPGIFMFLNNNKSAESFGKNVMPVYLSLQNPLIIDAKEADYFHIPVPKELDNNPVIDTWDTDLISDEAKKGRV